jgi:DNA helicase IV
VTQATVESLLGKYRFDGLVDTAEAAAVKASERMAAVIRRAARDASISLPADDLEVPFSTRYLRMSAKELAELIELAADGEGPWSVRRTNFRSSLFRALRDRAPEETPLEAVAGAVVGSPTARRAVDTAWKTVGAVALVQRLLTNRAALGRAAAGVLSDEDQAMLVRRKFERVTWTRHDLPLLDEAEAFLNGVSTRYGHIVVDEAQDRSPMELRVIGRRSTTGSMTILGDLAQATAVGVPGSWSAAAAHLGVPVEPRLVELTIGYRVPAAVLDFANRLLPLVAADVTAARSVREEGDPPSIVPCASVGEAVDEAATLAASFAQRFATTAVIGPARLLDGLAAALRGLDVSFGSTSLAGDVALLGPAAAKGLEFDAVVVVEPSIIVAEEPGAERALFVALTRAVQHLSVLHSEPLPAPLG